MRTIDAEFVRITTHFEILIMGFAIWEKENDFCRRNALQVFKCYVAKLRTRKNIFFRWFWRLKGWKIKQRKNANIFLGPDIILIILNKTVSTDLSGFFGSVETW